MSTSAQEPKEITIDEAIQRHVELIRKEKTLVTLTADTSVQYFKEASPDSFFFISRLLERLLDPSRMLSWLQTSVPEGFLEFTHPLKECCSNDAVQRGVAENQHILWIEDNTLHVLPKFQFHPFIQAKQEFLEETEAMVSKYAHYRVGHYHWNADKPFRFYKYTFDDVPDRSKYTALFLRAVVKSIESSNVFLTKELLSVNDSNDESLS